jgi:MFS family permease
VRRIFADITPLRRHRDFRRLWVGQLVSGMGSQLTVVAVALQAYRLTHSTLVVGLVSTAQLLPLLAGSLVGGALSDAKDRRRLLIITQLALALASAGLVVNAFASHPMLWPVFVCTAVSAAFQGVDSPTRKAVLPVLVPSGDLPAAIALQTVGFQWALVVGPTVAGFIIAVAGMGTVFLIDVATFGVSLVTVLLLPALVPAGGGTPAALGSIVEGLRYLRGQKVLRSTFSIDLIAMIFGMPRAVFPALGVVLFRGGASTVGLLYAAPGAGALLGSLLSGWIGRVRRMGRAVVVSVVLWGAAIAAFGLVRVLWVSLLLLALAGAADVVSAVFRNAILQLTVPDRLQGRLAGTFFAVVAGGPRLGDAETGIVASLVGDQVAVWSGGLACIAGVGVLLWRVPELWRHRFEGVVDPTEEERAIGQATAELGETEPI